MKFVVISDTHGKHDEHQLPQGDVLIHAGDFCHYGSQDNLRDFLQWYEELDFEHKIFIGGNHDFYAAEYPKHFKALIPKGIIYLEDNGIEINGLKFWGSPVQPDLTGWAFGKPRGAAMKRHWDLIPNDIDVLITHTPPFGILDKPRSGRSIGCEELSKKLLEVQPKVHIFGHVHASYGQSIQGKTTYINASSINSMRGIFNLPISIEL